MPQMDPSAAIKAYEDVLRASRELGLFRPDAEQRFIARRALSDACTVLHALRAFNELEDGWQIASSEGGDRLRGLLHNADEMGSFLEAELVLLRNAGLSTEGALVTIGTCLNTLRAEPDATARHISPYEWGAIFDDVLRLTCRLGEPESGDRAAKHSRRRWFLRHAVAAAGGAVVTLVNVSSAAAIANPALAAASAQLGAGTVVIIHGWLAREWRHD